MELGLSKPYWMDRRNKDQGPWLTRTFFSLRTNPKFFGKIIKTYQYIKRISLNCWPTFFLSINPCFRINFLSTILCHCGRVSFWRCSLSCSCWSLVGNWIMDLLDEGWVEEAASTIVVSLGDADEDELMVETLSSLSWRPSKRLSCCPPNPGSASWNSLNSLVVESESTTSLKLTGQGGVFR